VFVNNNDIAISNCTISMNFARSSGGALYALSANENVTIVNSRFYRNFAEISGGGGNSIGRIPRVSF
jgi:hypothetical protein